jgi:hypothetical protein
MRHVVAVVALLLASAAAGSVAVAQEAPGIDGPTETTFDVRLQADGDAKWVVRMVFPLDSDEERAAFRSYAEGYKAGDESPGPGVAFYRAAAERASQVADRGMRVVDVSRNASLGPERGTLTLSFVWTAFLGEDGDSYVLRDALRTPEGTWLHSLEGGQVLRIHTPPGYDIVRSIEARQENESLVITGPESFDPEEFAVAYEPADPQTNSETPTPTPENDWALVVRGLIGLLFAVVVVIVLWRGGESVLADGSDESEPVESGTEGAEAATGAEAGRVDPELLSDEERVEQLLEQRGGRMRQAEIVAETDWSDAKVSQLLSRMADEGLIEKLRLGRENVISLPEEDEE